MAIKKVVGGPKEKTGKQKNRRTEKQRNRETKQIIARSTSKYSGKFHRKKREELLTGSKWGWLGVITVAVVALGMTALMATSWWQRQTRIGLEIDERDSWSVLEGLGILKNITPVSPTPALPTPALLPEVKEETGAEDLQLTAESYLVMDVDSVVVLAKKDEGKLWPPASITKVMTAMVALESYPLEAVVTVEPMRVEGQKMDLIQGEKITVHNLLYGLLVESGNDAAEALASYFPGGRERFIEAMNIKAKAWHLNNTRFSNPSGIDGKYHFSTALDLARLTTMALKNEEFANIIATEKMVVESVDQSVTHHLENTNQLLASVNGVKGVKTGWTEEAGESLVALTERDGHRVVTVVLGSEDRFRETEKLIEWCFSNVEWRRAGN